MTQLVVIDEHTLGYILPDQDKESPLYGAGILHTSVLRGSTLNPMTTGTVLLKGRKVRLATKQDFDDYRVSFQGYENNPEYEYAKS